MVLPIPSRMKSGNASCAAKAMSFSQRVTSSDTEHPQGTAFTSENIQSKHESEPHKSTKRQLEHKHWNLKPIFNERHDWDCPWVTDMQHRLGEQSPCVEWGSSMFLELIHMPPLQKGQGLVGFFPFNNRNRLPSTVIFCWTSVFLIKLRTKLEFFQRSRTCRQCFINNFPRNNCLVAMSLKWQARRATRGLQDVRHRHSSYQRWLHLSKANVRSGKGSL